MAIRVLTPQAIQPEGEAYLRQRGYEVVMGSGVTEEEIIRDLAGCEAMIVRTAKITEKILAAAPELKVIARHGAGYDNIDIKAAREHNVLVLNAGGANAVSVAEVAIFYMLCCARNFKAVQAHYIENYNFAKRKIPQTELNGKVLGLIGIGNIGRLVAQKAAFGFDMKVIAYDPFFRGEVPDYLELVPNREDVFVRSDYVSLHVPATKETVGSVGEKEFKLMKPTAFLINTSRGSIVNEPALIAAIKNREIAGAGLDVLAQEPLDPKNELLSMENVVSAPHIGGMTAEAATRSSIECAEGVCDFFAGQAPKHIIPEMRGWFRK